MDIWVGYNIWAVLQLTGDGLLTLHPECWNKKLTLFLADSCASGYVLRIAQWTCQGNIFMRNQEPGRESNTCSGGWQPALFHSPWLSQSLGELSSWYFIRDTSVSSWWSDAQIVWLAPLRLHARVLKSGGINTESQTVDVADIPVQSWGLGIMLSLWIFTPEQLEIGQQNHLFSDAGKGKHFTRLHWAAMMGATYRFSPGCWELLVRALCFWPEAVFWMWKRATVLSHTSISPRYTALNQRERSSISKTHKVRIRGRKADRQTDR